jgi:lipid-A-disaccharide synthase
MLAAAEALGDQYQFLVPVASTLEIQQVQRFIGEITRAGSSGPAVRLVSDARDALNLARASVVASGTATVQAAVIGNPFIVVYRVSPMTFRLARRLVSYPAEIWPTGQLDLDGNLPIAMVNLIAGRRIVPELLQDRFTPVSVAAAIAPLLSDGPERDLMIADLSEVRRILEPVAGSRSICRVCDAVEELLGQFATSSGPNRTASV